MHYLAIAVVVFAVALALALAGLGSARAGEPEPAKSPAATAPAQPAAQPLSRAEIAKRLRQLANSPAPTKLAPGPMCYMVGARSPSPVVEYTCPVCGEKTLYAVTDAKDQERLADTISFLAYHLVECRRQAEAIREIEVRLDERQFCRKCSPRIAKPKLALTVKCAADKQATRCEDVTEEDLRLITEFLKGSKVHRGEQDIESPLRDRMDRLTRLLGVELPAVPNKK